MRPLGDKGAQWQDVTGAKIDPKTLLLVTTPSGRTINVFFYDGPVSQAVALRSCWTMVRSLQMRLLACRRRRPRHNWCISRPMGGD